MSPRDHSRRPCLRCSDASLDTIEMADVIRHVCARCGGMWIDDDQLGRLLARLGVESGEPLGAVVPVASSLTCPVCATAMLQQTSYGGESRVVIDVCPKHGAWFDQDELGVVVYALQEEHIARNPADLDAGTSLGTALRGLATTIRIERR